jgi:hypothetical protein
MKNPKPVTIDWAAKWPREDHERRLQTIFADTICAFEPLPLRYLLLCRQPEFPRFSTGLPVTSPGIHEIKDRVRSQSRRRSSHGALKKSQTPGSQGKALSIADRHPDWLRKFSDVPLSHFQSDLTISIQTKIFHRIFFYAGWGKLDPFCWCPGEGVIIHGMPESLPIVIDPIAFC